MSEAPLQSAPACPHCGEAASGTVETLTGVALIDGIEPDGEISYSGETKIDWDNQTTNRNAAGLLEFYCRPCCSGFFAAINEAAQ